MSTIYLASPTGLQSQHDEVQVRSFWEQGLLQEGTRYWKEGMADWKPISELFISEDVCTSSGNPPPLRISPYSFKKDPRKLTSFLIAMLWVCIGVLIVSVVSDNAQLILLDRVSSQFELESNDLRQAIIALAYLVTYFVTGITFLKWIYRANVNSRALGAENMAFSPGWSVGYYFIPFLNLVRPYQSMKEIWQISQNPKDWQTQGGSALLGWWWASWLGSKIVSQFASISASRAHTIEEVRVATGWSIFSSFVGIVACVFAMKLVKDVFVRQKELVEKSI